MLLNEPNKLIQFSPLFETIQAKTLEIPKLFPIEKNYKIVFKLLGIGLTFLSFALISGFSLQSVFTANIVFKAIFTFIAWIIYIITMVGIKFFNFPIKYATRSLFLAMWAVLAAYFMNSYITGS